MEKTPVGIVGGGMSSLSRRRVTYFCPPLAPTKHQERRHVCARCLSHLSNRGHVLLCVAPPSHPELAAHGCRVSFTPPPPQLFFSSPLPRDGGYRGSPLKLLCSQADRHVRRGRSPPLWKALAKEIASWLVTSLGDDTVATLSR